MSHHSKHRKERNGTAIRIVSLALAALMLLSVILTAVWQW